MTFHVLPREIVQGLETRHQRDSHTGLVKSQRISANPALTRHPNLLSIDQEPPRKGQSVFTVNHKTLFTCSSWLWLVGDGSAWAPLCIFGLRNGFCWVFRMTQCIASHFGSIIVNGTTQNWAMNLIAAPSKALLEVQRLLLVLLYHLGCITHLWSCSDKTQLLFKACFTT